MPLNVCEAGAIPAGSLTIVHAGRAHAVVDKPSGLLSVPGRGEDKQDCVAARVRTLFPHATGPITVHRLDWETSGLMVVALDADAHRNLSAQFMQRTVSKRYTAMLAGGPPCDAGVIDLPLRADWPNRPRQVVDFDAGRPARTRYIVAQRGPASTRVQLYPETGRSHQLRVHCASPRNIGGLGAPILGDALYGDPATAPRLMLHADTLAFNEPLTSNWVEYSSPPQF